VTSCPSIPAWWRRAPGSRCGGGEIFNSFQKTTRRATPSVTQGWWITSPCIGSRYHVCMSCPPMRLDRIEGS
jgi:hypothetical protein